MSFLKENSSFLGLIRHYAKRLRDPHAEGELWGFLWLIMNEHPNKPSRYYAVCLRNEYIRLSVEEKSFTLLGEYWQGNEEECDEKIDFSNALAKLTKNQAEIIQLYFVGGFSAVEIAELKHISRQAVCQCKDRALKELSEIFLDKGKAYC